MEIYSELMEEAKRAFGAGCFVASICCSCAALENNLREFLRKLGNIGDDKLDGGAYTLGKLLSNKDIKQKLGFKVQDDWHNRDDLDLLSKIRNFVDHGNWLQMYKYFMNLPQFKGGEKIEDINRKEVFRRLANFAWISTTELIAEIKEDKATMILIDRKINRKDYDRNLKYY